MGSPPLARGIHVLVIKDYHPVRITPACAGNTVCNGSARTGAWDHPRLRGEYDWLQMRIQQRLGSPPLARGIPFLICSYTSSGRITPACAGNTLLLQYLHQSNWDRPRLRGEYVEQVMTDTLVRGSPPLARGIRSRECLFASSGRITPACAGNTVILFSGAAICGDHPRLRGEYNRTTCNRKYHIGSPPLARGILNRERIGQRRGGITPACAGNTVRCSSTGRFC